jgi:hypothetical protein
MTTITVLAMLAILVGSTLSITGFSVVSSIDAQMTGDNATMSGNMTGGNATGDNMSGSISSEGDFVQGGDGGETVIEGGDGGDDEYESDDEGG